MKRQPESIATSLALVEAVKVVSDLDARHRLVRQLCQFDRFTVVSFINANGVMLAARDPAYRRALIGADYLLRDGIGCQLLMKAAGLQAGINVNGTDLIPELMQGLKGRTIALYGTSEPFVSSAASVLSGFGLKVVDICDGFQSLDHYRARLERARPDVLLLGMGMPKQEQLSAYLQQDGGAALLAINGGAIADFLAGRFSRAPSWARRVHLEWLFRFFQEPRRLFRRYFIDGFHFAVISLQIGLGRYRRALKQWNAHAIAEKR